MPSGLEKVILKNKSYQDTNTDDLIDLITNTVTVNNKATTLVHNTLLAEKTITSPAGRINTIHYNPATLLTESISAPGLFDTHYSYDNYGKPTSVATNTRLTEFTYNAQGFLESITGPENHTKSFTYDAVGRERMRDNVHKKLNNSIDI